jgi:AraC-like DNA-binding protein
MHALFPREFSKVSTSIFEMPDFEHFVREMDSFLLSQIREEKTKSRAYRIVDQSVATLFTKIPELPIDTLHQISGISKRYLQTSFRDLVGLSPKQLFKMIRFQSCFQKLHMSNSLTDVALQCGYYDHAHFTHDFREYSGTTPSKYREMDMPLNRFFLDASSRAWLCNYTN